MSPSAWVYSYPMISPLSFLISFLYFQDQPASGDLGGHPGNIRKFLPHLSSYVRTVQVLFQNSMADIQFFQIIQDSLGAVVDIPFYMDVPDVSGKKEKEAKSQKKAQKKSLSLFISVKKEGQSILSDDLDFQDAGSLPRWYSFHKLCLY